MVMHEKELRGQKLMRLILLTVSLSSMTATMFNIVLPQISREFQLSITQVSWLSSAYALIYAFGTITYGKLADKFQLKNILTFGLSIFALGSFIGLVSQSFWLALLGRCLQSAGASAIPAVAMIIPVRYFSQDNRGQALSMTAVGVALGSALGPIVTTLIVSIANWRWLFLPPLLILSLLPFYRKYLLDEANGGFAKFDWLGGGLLAGTASLFLLGVTYQAWLLIGLGVISLALFVLRILKAKEPFIQPTLFQNKKYSIGLLIAVSNSAVGTALFFITPLLLAEVNQLSSDWIGFALIPAALVASILGRKGGKLADKKGNRYLYTLASCLYMSCFILLSSLAGISPIYISLILIIGQVGLSFISIATSNTISRTLPKDQAGIGMGLYSMLNFIVQGMAMGVYSIIIVLGTTTNWNPLNMFPQSYIFSNIYLVLATISLVLLGVYYVQFKEVNTGMKMEAP